MNSNSSQRIRIFDRWDIKHIHIEDQNKQTTPTFSYAENIIHQAELLLFNIEHFLTIKRHYTQKATQLQSHTNQILQNLHLESNNTDSISSIIQKNILQYKEHLKTLYKTLRSSKVFQESIELYFQNANLVNYDPNMMELKFTKSKDELDQQLTQWTEQLRRFIFNLVNMITLGSKELSFVFTKEYTLDYCLDKLSQKLSHDNLVQIHYIMIFQIEDFSTFFKAFKENTRVTQAEYLKYEMIFDCIKLMESQSQQMSMQLKLLQKQIQDVCNNPKQTDYHYYLTTFNRKSTLYANNINIYQTNLENFTRVNVETDMYYYAELKSKFTQQLDHYIQALKYCKNDQESIIYLLQRYSMFNDLHRRVELTNKLNQTDRKFTQKLYNQCSEYEIHKSNSFSGPNNRNREAQIVNLKKTVVEQIHHFLVDKKIAYQKHLSSFPELQKYKAFFKDLHETSVYRQYEFLAEQKHNLNAYTYELKQLLAEQTQRSKEKKEKDGHEKQYMIQSYSLAMLYASIVANKQPFQSKEKEFQALNSQKGFQNLPLTFQDLIFNYINDISIISESELFINSLTITLQPFISALTKRLQKQKIKPNMDSLIEQQLQNISKTWVTFYHDYLNKISRYGISFISTQINRLCYTIQSSLHKCFKESRVVDRLNMNIDKNMFFSHRVLRELLQIVGENQKKKKLMRIVNIDSMIDNVYKVLDRSFMDRSAGGKISEVIKLSLLQEYFRIVYKEDHPQYCSNFTKLKYFTYLQSISEIYPVIYQEQEFLLSNLLKIHLQFHSITLFLPFGHKDRAQLDNKTLELIKELFKYPLTIATKRNVIGFIYIFRYNELIKTILHYQRSTLSILEISRLYLHILELKEITKVVELPYESYENIIVKHNKKIVRYLQAKQKFFKPKIDLYQKELEQLYKNYLNKKQVVSIHRSIEFLCKKLDTK